MGKKRTRKMRGKKTFGYGSKKKHRGAGSRGGRGMAGSFDHKRIKIIKSNPERYGKKGFKRKQSNTFKTINLKQIDSLSIKLGKKNINLSELGYEKVLGTGKITRSLEIVALSFSESARAKIEEAGGKAILLEKATEILEKEV